MYRLNYLPGISLTIGLILCHQRAVMSTTNKPVITSAVRNKARTISALSLSGPPVCKLVEPGKCQFTEDWTACKLVERIEVSSTTSLLRFDLPDKNTPLNLSTCACILSKAKLPNREGEYEDVIRPYTPISTNELVGHFDLLVKVCFKYMFSIYSVIIINFHTQTQAFDSIRIMERTEECQGIYVN